LVLVVVFFWKTFQYHYGLSLIKMRMTSTNILCYLSCVLQDSVKKINQSCYDFYSSY